MSETEPRLNDGSPDGSGPAEDVAAAETAKLVPVYVMGKRYMVPETLTIMKAMEYAGFQFIRGCGCRGGICGACATVYRKAGEYKLRVGLACQTVVEPDMYLAQIPFYPANRARCDFSRLTAAPEEVFRLYPELFRCIACNLCSKACPMDVPMMDVVSALKQGNIARAATLSFSCIQCGLCASRCMGELPQYHMAQLVRRLYGGKLAAQTPHLEQMVEKIAAGYYQEKLDELKAMPEDDLKKLYSDRQQEPHQGDEYWKPESEEGL